MEHATRRMSDILLLFRNFSPFPPYLLYYPPHTCVCVSYRFCIATCALGLRLFD